MYEINRDLLHMVYTKKVNSSVHTHTQQKRKGNGNQTDNTFIYTDVCTESHEDAQNNNF